MPGSEGIMPALVDEMFAPFRAMKPQGMTVLLVEQNVELALDIADPTDVLDQGAVVYHAAVSELWPTMRSRSVIARCDAVLQRDGQIVNAQAP
jgi:ABC-type branched-subunit amino acid transport system ATPase component